MTMDQCSENMTWANCKSCYEDFHDVLLQNALDAIKPWIGMYIAVASAVCGIAMAVDVFVGFKTKQIWFPCKYFSLNATFLTVLAVQMKLTMDLTSSKYTRGIDECAGYSSVVFMLSAMSNFMTSLASMDDNEIMLNLTALSILVITVDVNVYIFDVQSNKVHGGRGPYADDFVVGFILLFLIFQCNLAFVARTTKRYVETKFWEIHNKVLSERERGAKFTVKELTTVIKKYWVMAGTGNPQFVMARSVICVIPNVISLLTTITLLLSIVYFYTEEYDDFFHSESAYKWSVNWILIIQTLGAVFGTIAPTFRLFVAARIKSSWKGFKAELKIEPYWTRRLKDWREYSIPIRIGHVKIKKSIHISKKLLLNICIVIQIVIVFASKLILIIYSWFINLILKFVHIFKSSSDRRGHESRVAGTNASDFTPYVMLLEGEIELPNRIIANISNEADKLIQVGKKQKPEKIIELLQKSVNFNGIRDFDRKNIASIHLQESRNCWSLSVVTLTKIAIAVPNISSDIVNNLFSSVGEGLQLVKFIEEQNDRSGELVRIRKTADSVWEQFELENWKNKDDVQGNNMKDQTYKAKLIELSTKAKETILGFKDSTTDPVMLNPLNWTVEVIAAYSMYRVCESLLLIEIEATEDQLDQNFFERVTIIISDLLAACLTNLAHLIFTQCHIISIEKRQESIRRTLILLGKSEEIIQCLEHREWPNLDIDKAGYIEEWQAILELNNENSINSVTATDDGSIPQSSNGQLVVKVES